MTEHNLLFESCAWAINPSIQCFRIGTCTGQWFAYDSSYVILTVINHEPGNGHLNDVFQWFEASAKRDKYALEVWEIMNKRFYDHLLNKRGFKIPQSKFLKDHTALIKLL